jgi:hypothetical protein
MWEDKIGQFIRIQKKDSWVIYGILEAVDDNFISIRFKDGRVQGICRADIHQFEFPGVGK